MNARSGLVSRARGLAAALALAVGGACVVAPAARAASTTQSAPDAGRAWSPPALRPTTHSLGSMQCPKPFDVLEEQCHEDYRDHLYPDLQLHVPTQDEAEIYVDVWLPRELGRPDVKAGPVPVVALVGPYFTRSETIHMGQDGARELISYRDILVQRGYAYAQVHTRGTGSSGGCFEAYTARDAEDTARVVQALAEAPWSSGRVALAGSSYEATAALNAAARGPRERLAGLATVVAVSPLVSPADVRTRDGVVISEIAASMWKQSNTDGKTLTPGSSDLADTKSPYVLNPAERAPCRLQEGTQWALDVRGGVNDWEVERDLRSSVQDVAVPVLLTMGLQEVQMRGLPGFLDGLGEPAGGGPKKVALLGQWGHDYPHANARVPEWARADAVALVVAWLDRWMVGADTGVQGWPTVQVQDTEGQWRAEPGFPSTGGPTGRLALGGSGSLGASSDPTGSDVLGTQTFIAPRVQSGRVAGDTSLLWQTAPLSEPLRITGEPVLDLWVQLDRPAGQVVAELVAVDATGNPLNLTRRVGARSLRYLDPIVNGRFTQRTPSAPPVGVPLQVQLRLDPTDLVVPEGGRLQLRLATTGPAFNGEVWRDAEGRLHSDRVLTVPDAEGGDVTILHSCEHLSALRFLVPGPGAQLLDVQEADQESSALGQSGPHAGDHGTGGGLATATVCGERAERLDSRSRQ